MFSNCVFFLVVVVVLFFVCLLQWKKNPKRYLERAIFSTNSFYYTKACHWVSTIFSNRVLFFRRFSVFFLYYYYYSFNIDKRQIKSIRRNSHIEKYTIYCALIISLYRICVHSVYRLYGECIYTAYKKQSSVKKEEKYINKWILKNKIKEKKERKNW